MASKPVTACLLLILAARIAWAEDALSDTRLNYRIGIAKFVTEGLSPENLYIGSSYPLLIYEGLARVDSHLFSPRELDGYRALIVDREKHRLSSERDRVLLARDAAYFTRAGGGAGSSGARLSEIADALEHLSTYDLESIEVRSEKPVEMVGGPDQVLMPAGVHDPAIYAEAAELDLLVYGLVEEIETYLFVDVFAYSAAVGEVLLYQTGFSREMLTGSSEVMLRGLLRTVLGRDWATLRVSASPETAEIYLNGTFRGIGEVSLEFAPPGEHDIRIIEYGYYEYQSEVTLLVGDQSHVNAVLQIGDVESTGIVTVPAGADVYALSQWQGTTPVYMPPGMENIQGLIRKEGYSDYLLPVLPSGQDEVQIRLMPEIVNRRQLMDEQRSDFYTVFAAFILSLPLPIFFFDATNTLTLSYLSEARRSSSDRNLDEALRLLNVRQISLSAYVGTFFISAALLTDAVLELLKFMDLVNLSTY